MKRPLGLMRALAHWQGHWRDQLGHLAEVLGCGGEEELIVGAIWSSQAQSTQLEDAFQVREQHFDLLSLSA